MCAYNVFIQSKGRVTENLLLLYYIISDDFFDSELSPLLF